ncbi:MAG: serine hydrolase domain-containing protein [Myxococcaceae bacterium]
MNALLATLCFAAAPQDLHAVAQQAFDERHVAGMVVAVEKDGQLLLSEGFGFADVERRVKAAPGTVFHYDSITKQITAAALLKLAEQGKVKLDDDVHKYVPLGDATPVPLRALLNHTSGLVSFDTLPEFVKHEREDVTPAQLLAMLEGQPRYFKPGESFRYTNTGFWLAGQVIEKASGVSYSEYVRTNLFAPLRKKEPQGPVTAGAAGATPAQGYLSKGNGFVKAPALSWVPVSSAGAVTGTAGDLLLFEAGLDTLLSKDDLAAMRAPTKVRGMPAVDYGLGTRLGQLEHHKMTGHTGSGGGYTTAALRFPDEKLTVVVLMNTEGGSASMVATALARAALDLGPMKQPADVPLTAMAANWPGTYTSEEVRVEVTLNEGRVFATPAGAPGPLPMIHLGDDVFAFGPGRTVRFVGGVKGAAATVYADGLMVDYARRGN